MSNFITYSTSLSVRMEIIPKYDIWYMIMNNFTNMSHFFFSPPTTEAS